MWKLMQQEFTQRRGMDYFYLLLSLGIGYFSPLVAVILFLFTRKNEKYRIYGYCAILTGCLALVQYLIQSIL